MRYELLGSSQTGKVITVARLRYTDQYLMGYSEREDRYHTTTHIENALVNPEESYLHLTHEVAFELLPVRAVYTKQYFLINDKEEEPCPDESK